MKIVLIFSCLLFMSCVEVPLGVKTEPSECINDGDEMLCADEGMTVILHRSKTDNLEFTSDGPDGQ